MPTKKTTTKVETKSNSTNKVEPKKDAAKSLDDLFEDCLKDAYWAENAVKDALPKMIKNASSPKLKQALDDHLEETKDQIKILKDVFKSIGTKPEAEKCDAMAGILEEGEGILEETEPGAVRDAGIIAACQKVEHYEIASYGTMISYAKILKNKEAKQLIDSILKQEKNADKILSKLATSEINLKANK
jgi:ferritin-like metal-binding protein YciE